MNSMNGIKDTLELDRERVACLLVINTHLFKRAIKIYTNVLTNQTALQQLLPQNKQAILSQYQNYIRTIHCNLAVLSYIHEKYTKEPGQVPTNKTQFPIIMSAPPDMPELNLLYLKLRELYPEAVQFWKAKINNIRQQNATNQSSTLSSQQMPSREHSPMGLYKNVQSPVQTPNMAPRAPQFQGMQNVGPAYMSSQQKPMAINMRQQNMMMQNPGGINSPMMYPSNTNVNDVLSAPQAPNYGTQNMIRPDFVPQQFSNGLKNPNFNFQLAPTQMPSQQQQQMLGISPLQLFSQ